MTNPKHPNGRHAATATLIALASLLPQGCESPLFNHASADERGLLTSPAPNDKDCPLAFPKSALCAELAWTSALNDQDPATFTLRFWSAASSSAAGPYVTPAHSVKVQLWMPSMGHGSSPVTLAPAQDAASTAIPGIYEGESAYFIMPGAWDVRVQLKQGATTVEEAILPVQI
jgi:hypothetical protein